MDAVRARNTSLYGHINETTPNLSNFSENATVYKQARAPGTSSLSSHTSIFTGYHVAEHDIVTSNDGLELGHTVWEWLQNEHGYSTAVFSSNPFITDSSYGLEAGFEEVYRYLPTLQYPFEQALTPDSKKFRGGSGTNKLSYILSCLQDDRPIGRLLTVL
jgi:arylsulfatase A-like enzyme